MRRKVSRVAALLAGIAVVASGCGSGSSGDGSDGQGDTVTVGLLASTTGEAAAGHVGTVRGVKARIEKANAEHELGDTTIKLVVGDDASTPAGSLKAAKDLVENKGAAAVLSWSAYTYGSYRYLAREDIPVVGGAIDGPEWGSQDNMFAIEGTLDPRLPAPTTWGKMMKSQGVTKMAILGMGASPSSIANVKNVKASVAAAGIDPVYVNTSIPFGSTDMGSVALAVKNSGANGLYPAVFVNSSYALLTALKQQGVDMKAALLATGYGQSLLDNATAVKTAEGAYFLTPFKPVEVQDAATRQWQADLKKYADFTGSPTFGIAGGWLVADALIAGLQKVQGEPSPESITKAMTSVTHWTADGLYAKARNFGANQPIALGMNPGNCIYVSKVENGRFVPINDGKAFCGKLIPHSYANPDGN